MVATRTPKQEVDPMPAQTISLAELRQRATVTITEAGELLGVSRAHAFNLARSGDLPTLKLGRRRVVSAPRLLAMLEAPSDMESEGPAA